MKDNPKAALAALTSPAKLTLGKVALLCRLDSPILAGKIDDMPKCLTAIFVVENDFADSVANFGRIDDLALIAYGGISPLEYRQKLAHTLDEVAAFFAGEKSAADTAAMVQSRVNLYVQEQS